MHAIQLFKQILLSICHIKRRREKKNKHVCSNNDDNNNNTNNLLYTDSQRVISHQMVIAIAVIYPLISNKWRFIAIDFPVDFYHMFQLLQLFLLLLLFLLSWDLDVFITRAIFNRNQFFEKKVLRYMNGVRKNVLENNIETFLEILKLILSCFFFLGLI